MAGIVDQPAATASSPLWQQYCMALDRVTDRMERITTALDQAAIGYALVGGQAVALWVATRDPAAVRTTKDVDLLVRRADLPLLRAAGLAAGFDYFETLGVGMLLDRSDANPRHAVQLVWAGEKVRPHEAHPMPTVERRQSLDGRWQVVSLLDLAAMKLVANRDQDRVHLRDMIDVGLIDRTLSRQLPPDLQSSLEKLLTEQGR